MKYLLLLVVIGGGVYFVSTGGDMSFLSTTTATQTTITSDGSDPNASSLQEYAGDLDINIKINDALSIGTTYTDSTEVDTNYYKTGADGNPIYLGQSSSGTFAIDVDEDVKTIWAETVIPSGQAYYIDSAGTQASSNRVGEPIWADFDNNGLNTYIFPLRVTGFNSDATDPSFTWSVSLIDEDSVIVKTTAPADVTGIGTGSQTCDIDWEIRPQVEGDGEFLTRVILSKNSTSVADMDATKSWLNIAGTQFFLDPLRDEKASTTEFEKVFATEYGDGGVLLKYPVNGEQDYNFNAKIYTNFDASNEGHEWTLKVYTENAQGSETEITDAVKCLEA